MTIEYDGTDFSGLQWQVNQRTVQGELETAIQKLSGQSVRVTAAGRTDAGVHALGQVIDFSVSSGISIEQWPVAMNSVLPGDLSVKKCTEVDDEFHSRFSAKSRSYVYAILNRPMRSAVWSRFAAHYPYELCTGRMEQAAQLLLGTHDFRAYANNSVDVTSTIRQMSKCTVKRRNEMILVHVEANAFLRGMVRNIVGTLLEVGSGKREPEEVSVITLSGDRRKAGPSAPARGLCLVRVRY